MASSTTYPVSVTGGCLCGSIRYKITFPESFTWPPTTNGTCQCTICRKFTGALIPQSISVPTACISPPLSVSMTLKWYSSTSTGARSFCSECGSSMTFNYVRLPERTEIYLATLDEEVLLGKKTGEVEDGEYGKKAIREGGWGELLCSTENSGHIWFENAIPGVTDNLPGLKYWRERSDGKGFENMATTK